MSGILNEIQREHRSDKLIESIEKERITLRELSSRTKKREYVQDMKPVYEGFLEEINHLLWTHEYLMEKTYRLSSKGTSKIGQDYATQEAP
jgi:hypothetical protein